MRPSALLPWGFGARSQGTQAGIGFRRGILGGARCYAEA
jgi:hypothetical protein